MTDFPVVPPQMQRGYSGEILRQRGAYKRRTALETARETLYDALLLVQDTRGSGETLERLGRVVTLLERVDREIDNALHTTGDQLRQL